jgi:hypothetical protein
LSLAVITALPATSWAATTAFQSSFNGQTAYAYASPQGPCGPGAWVLANNGKQNGNASSSSLYVQITDSCAGNYAEGYVDNLSPGAITFGKDGKVASVVATVPVTNAYSYYGWSPPTSFTVNLTWNATGDSYVSRSMTRATSGGTTSIVRQSGTNRNATITGSMVDDSGSDYAPLFSDPSEFSSIGIELNSSGSISVTR